ncbi:MAG: YybS family protein [Desulfobacterales bacterium]|nr:YybS family protein [Desulfobacterales bacterium]
MKITDMLGCTGWAGFLLLASSYIPLFGPFLGMLTPLPFFYYSSKLGSRQGIKLGALVILTIGVAARFAGQHQIILLCIELGILGLVLSELFKRGFSPGQIIFPATVFMLFLGIGSLYFIGLSRDLGPFEMMLNYLQENLDAAIRTYKDMETSRENALELEAYGKVFMDTISAIYPSLMVLGAGFVVWINFIIARQLSKIGKLAYPDFVPLDHWQAPEGMIWGVIISGFALFLLSGGVKLVLINALIVMIAIYFFHGLSIILFFFNKYNIPSWIKIGVYLLILIQQIFLVLLILAGIFDQWIDFRKIHRKMEG